MQNRQNAARYLKDAGKALLLGLAAAAAVFAVLFLVGLCTHGFAPLAGLDLARRGLFLVGALALLVSAGALLLPEKAASVREKEGWNARFSCHCLCQQRFTGSGRTLQKHTLGNPCTHLGILSRLPQKIHNLCQVFLLFLQTGYLTEIDALISQ